jgi:hypothetical protein
MTKQFRIPDYDIDVFEVFDIYHFEDESKKTIMRNKVHNWLKPLNGISYPIGMGFCGDVNERGNCNESTHAVVISGVREICDNKNKCDTEWYIINSYGGENQGWHRSEPFIKSLIKYKPSYLTRITPKNQIYIDVKRKIRHLVEAGNLAAIVNLVNNDNDNNKYLYQTNSDDVNMLHLAVKHGNLNIVKYLTEEAKATVDEKDNDGWTALNYAYLYQYADIINYLIKDAK